MTYQIRGGGLVKMTNSARSRITEVGIIQVIRRFEGVVWMLTGVKHLQDLKEILISFKMLDVKGYLYFSEGRMLKISEEL